MVSNVDKKTSDDGLPVRLVNYTDVYSGRDIRSSVRLMKATASREQIQRFRVLPGDSIITKDSESPDDIGVAAYVAESEPDMVCGYHLALIRPKETTDGRFLSWVLRSDPVLAHFSVSATGMTRYGLNYESIESVSIPLIDLDEQRRIADFLDDQVARIDCTVAARVRQIALFRDGFEATREAAVEGQSDAVRRPLVQFVPRHRPINYGVLMPGPRLEVGVPLVEAGDVMRGPIDVDELRRTTPVIEAEFSRSRLAPEDLVMAIRGSVGRVEVMPSFSGIANVTRDAARISLNGQIAAPRYFRHALMTRRMRDWFGLRVLGSAVTGINIGDLRRAPLTVPPRVAQDRVASVLDEAEGRLGQMVALLAASSERLVELKQSLITAAVTGEFEISTADGSRVSVS